MNRDKTDTRASRRIGQFCGRSPLLLVLLLLAVCAGGTVAAEARKRPHWVHEQETAEPVRFDYRRIELKYCEFLTTSQHEDIAGLLGYPDRLFETILDVIEPDALSDEQGGRRMLKPKLVIRLFAERDEFRKFALQHRPVFADFNGYATNRQVVLWYRPSTYLNVRLIAHEMVHGILCRSIEDAPWWLHEGLARDLSSFRFGDENLSYSPFQQREAARMLQAWKKGDWVPLLELLALKPEDVYVVEEGEDPAKAKQRRRLLYAEVWALIYYIRRDPRLRRTKALEKYLDAVRRGYTSVGAFRDVFGINITEFERDWVRTLHRWYTEHAARR